ncbi:DMT family transporter [Effusibacillus dendaii]|uniref:EamA domain-containing protein n=1 Tax=Effusibacillus dendaii TaxID=2743772 RepID=A0A7I8DDW2_9BACL|nr:DMT family transporter [Effusibacillus dendaii]BCJ88388.1 hypothetical protein skT53_33730 [Effusibacillus dendaii]
MGELLAILALVLFSSNIILTKVAASRLSLNLGFLISVSVNVLFSALILLVQFLFRPDQINWNTIGFLLFLLSGFFNTYLGRWFFFDSIDKLGPAKASAFQISNPLFTVLIACVFLGERLTLLDGIAILTVLAGLFLISYVPRAFAKKEVAATDQHIMDLEPEARQPGTISRKKTVLMQSGIFLALSSTFSYAVGNVLRGAAIHDWNQPILGALLGAVSGLALHFLTNSGTRTIWRDVKRADRKGLVMYIVSGMMTISAQICVIASMWYIPVSLANLITMSTPLLVTPMSYFLLKNQEGLTVRTVSGIGLVLIGITAIVLM